MLETSLDFGVGRRVDDGATLKDRFPSAGELARALADACAVEHGAPGDA